MDKRVMTPDEVKALARPLPKGEKVGAGARGKRRVTNAAQKAPIHREPPRGQTKGPIIHGPAEWIPCVPCSRLFSTPEKPVRYGIRKRHAVKHLADHRMGRIRRPVEPKAKK